MRIGNRIGVQFDSQSWQSYWATRSLFFLDGTMLDVAGTKYFKDKSSAARNFLITGYDFDSIWTKGFPYKSAATISAPAADAVLIAADINNFLYAGDGTPNQIPVVSLFQDIDYAHKIFCRNVDQVLDVNGVETTEPHVIEIYMANVALTGSNLLKAQTYFSVTTEIVSNVFWIDGVNGLDVNDGSKAHQWKTIEKINTGLAADNDNVYAKTSLYTVAAQVAPTKTSTLNGIGLTKLTTAIDQYIIYFPASAKNHTLKRLIIDGDGKGGCYVSGVAAIINTINNCKFVNNIATKYLLQSAAGAQSTFNNCILDSRLNTNGCSIINSTFNGCVIYSENKTFILGASGGTVVIRYSKITHKSSVADSSIIGTTVKQNITFEYNDVKLIQDGKAVLRVYTADDATGMSLTCKYNKCLSDTYGLQHFIQSFVVNLLYDIKNNYINVNSLSVYGMYLKAPANNSEITYNSITSTLGALLIQTENQVAGRANTVIKINYNYLALKGNSGKHVGIGLETTDVNNNELFEGSELVGNYLRGFYYYTPLGGASTQHGLYSGFQKNTTIKYNKVHGPYYGIVYKGGGQACTTGMVFSNLIVGTSIGIYFKGVSGGNAIGNTIVKRIDTPFIGVYFTINTTGTPAINGTVKNNIICSIASGTNCQLIYCDATSATGLTSDYNIFYSVIAKPFRIGTTDYSFAEWQSLGHDAHSIMLTEAQYNNLFIDASNGDFTLKAGSAAIGAGVVLDAIYDDGLDVSTNFGSETLTPVIVTKQQGAVWDIGAYIH